MLLLILCGVFISSFVMFVATLKSMSGYIHAGWILPILYGMIFCNGIARAFFGPAIFTIYANSIPREIYPNASYLEQHKLADSIYSGPACRVALFMLLPAVLPAILS